MERPRATAKETERWVYKDPFLGGARSSVPDCGSVPMLVVGSEYEGFVKNPPQTKAKGSASWNDYDALFC